MKGLKIEIKEIPLKEDKSKIWDYLEIGVLILVGLLLLPILIIFWVGGLIFNFFASNKVVSIANEWNTIVADEQLTLKYKWKNAEDLPDYLCGFFDIQPLMEYQIEPELEFFRGYFTDFKLERSDGIFIQKVIHNPIKKEVESLPLCFFKYQTLEIEVIKDLKDYSIDTKGNPDDFLISAFGEDHELQIRLKK